MHDVKILIPIAIIGIMCLGAVLCALHERKLWNRGFCSECGEPWRSFDMTSQG